MQPQSPNPIREAVEAVGRQWTLFLITYGAILALALVACVVLRPSYQASSRVLLTSTRASISTTPDRPSNLERSSEVSDTEIGSQLEIIGSLELIGATLRDMGIVPEPPDSGWLSMVRELPRRVIDTVVGRERQRSAGEQDDPMLVLAAHVRESMEVQVVKRSNIIEIAITHRDPVWARDFVNRLTAIYIDRHAQLRQTSGAEDFFHRQSQLLKEKLTDSELALRELRQRAGTLAGQRAEIEKLLAQFTEELAKTRVAREEQERRVAYITSVRQRSNGGRLATPKLLELEAQRAEMIGKYRADSEKVRQIEEQITTLRAALSKYDAVVATETGGPSDGGTDPIVARANLEALAGKEAALARQRDEYKRQLEHIEAQSFDIVRLDRQVKLDEDAYLSYVRAAEQSRLSNALEQSRLLRLTVVDRAQLPREPVAPKKGRILSFAAIGGLAVALGCALLRDRTDTTVKSVADVQRYANVEVLSVVRRTR